MLERILPRPSSSRLTTAAAVSSQVVSMPRTSIVTSTVIPGRPKGGSGIHIQKSGLWIPGSRASLTPRNDDISAGLTSRGPVAQSIRIGTRGSPLALAQAKMVRDALVEQHAGAIEIVTIRTSGDRIQDRPLSEAGGKGLFTKEIEEALLAGAIDLAVHSAKDMPTALPDGLMLAACLPREDVRDAFISRKAASLRELAQGAVIGTASLRRQAMVKRLRPDVSVVSLRGNVETRLRKLEAGEVDATLLALAGLKRLGFADKATALLDAQEFLPAVGQGAITIETRIDDARTRELLAKIDHA